MRLIDADAIAFEHDHGVLNGVAFVGGRTQGKTLTMVQVALKKMIENAPTIDAEPVVRCKDCKHFMEFTETFREMIKFDGSCRLLVGFTECDREMRKYTDYCSSGAKMDLEVEE